MKFPGQVLLFCQRPNSCSKFNTCTFGISMCIDTSFWYCLMKTAYIQKYNIQF